MRKGASTVRLRIPLSPRSPHLLWTLVWPCKSLSKAAPSETSFCGNGALENEFVPCGESVGEKGSIILLRRGPRQSGSGLRKKPSTAGVRWRRPWKTNDHRGNSRARRRGKHTRPGFEMGVNHSFAGKSGSQNAEAVSFQSGDLETIRCDRGGWVCEV